MSSYANDNAPWLNPEYATSKFIKFTTPGDTIVMVLRGWGRDEFPADGDKPARPYPVMIGTVDGEEKELGLTLVDMKEQVFKLRPGIGDTVTIRYARDGKPKLFDVRVDKAVASMVPSGAATGQLTAENIAAAVGQEVAPF